MLVSPIIIKRGLGKNDGGGKHVLIWDQDLPPDVNQENSERIRVLEVIKKPPRIWGVRHGVTLMLFLGMANAYIMRVNMSVAIVAMVNQTALPKDASVPDDECGGSYSSNSSSMLHNDGTFIWTTAQQGIILSSFFYGYVITQIPFGLLAKKYGAKYFLGVGMLINSLFGFLVPIAAKHSLLTLTIIRFIQGLGEGPIVPCTHAMLAKWIPPNERSTLGAFVYAGAQFGTIFSLPLSGLLAEYGFFDGWPSIFYVFGLVGAIWSVAFLVYCYEEPEAHPNIAEDEKRYIMSSVWRLAGVASSAPIPWRDIVYSPPFWAILIAHIGQNYGYETLMTELPTFMKQVLHFNIKANGTLSALPYLAMWSLSFVFSIVADWMITSERFSHTTTRKLLNAIGQYGPAICLVGASFTGCEPYLTVALLTLGLGLNGAVYSGFKVNHLDISPRFAGILMSFTNCLANLAGLLAPFIAGNVLQGRPTQAAWRVVFVTAAVVYLFSSTFYILFGSGKRQPWDDPNNDLINNNCSNNKINRNNNFSKKYYSDVDDTVL